MTKAATSLLGGVEPSETTRTKRCKNTGKTTTANLLRPHPCLRARLDRASLTRSRISRRFAEAGTDENDPSVLISRVSGAVPSLRELS